MHVRGDFAGIMAMPEGSLNPIYRLLVPPRPDDSGAPPGRCCLQKAAGKGPVLAHSGVSGLYAGTGKDGGGRGFDAQAARATRDPEGAPAQPPAGLLAVLRRAGL